MTYSKCFSFVLFLTIFGNVNAQQVAFVRKDLPSLAIFNIEGTEKSKTFNSKKVKAYEPIKSNSYNIMVVNQDSCKVFNSLFRSGKFVNQEKEKGKIVYSIITLTDNATVDIEVQKL